jgi:hypothetical protein
MMRAMAGIGVEPRAPTFDRTHAEAHEATRRAPPRAGEHGGLDECLDHRSGLGVVISSSSPQISCTFFFSTKSAAVSANAASFRRTSRSSS